MCYKGWDAGKGDQSLYRVSGYTTTTTLEDLVIIFFTKSILVIISCLKANSYVQGLFPSAIYILPCNSATPDSLINGSALTFLP